MCEDYLKQLKNAKKTCIISNNLKKVHYDFGNGIEMAEEYNIDTKTVVRRAWKRKRKLSDNDNDQWDIELGEPEPKYNKNDMVIVENATQPFVTRRSTRINLEWRIRNLPYPLPVYSITVDEEKCALIVRTSNKKYFKILTIPELERLKLLPNISNIECAHRYNTLIITYRKPQELIDFEGKVWEEVSKLKPKNYDEMDCKPS